jgi:predicted SprT family Zn-dependent metalloprotease
LKEELRQVIEGAKKADEKWKEILDQVKSAAKDAEVNVQLRMVRQLPFYESCAKKAL